MVGAAIYVYGAYGFVLLDQFHKRETARVISLSNFMSTHKASFGAIIAIRTGTMLVCQHFCL